MQEHGLDMMDERVEEIGQGLPRGQGPADTSGSRARRPRPLIRTATVKSLTSPESMSSVTFRPSAYSMRYSTGSRDKARQLPEFGIGVAIAGARRGEGEAAAEAGLERVQIASSLAPRARSRAFQTLRPARPDTATTPVSPPLPPLDQALDRLEAVKVVAVDSAITHADGFVDRRAQRHIDRRQSAR